VEREERGMGKVKTGLTLLTIAIIIGPIVGVIFVERNNLIGLILPPQFSSMLSGVGSANSTTSQLSQFFSNIQAPQAGQLQYDSATGAFSLPFNITNPLSTQVSVNQVSAEVVSGSNVPLGNISVSPMTIAPGASVILDVAGNLNQNTVNQLAAQNSTASGLNVSLENVVVNVDGVVVHINQMNIGSIPAFGGTS